MQKLLFLFCFFCSVALNAKDVHPYHVGSVEFNYNAASKTFQISGKFFLDDMENALKEKYATAVHFNDAKYKTELAELLRKYFTEYIKLKSDGKQTDIRFLGYEEDSESVNVYLESGAVNPPKKVEVAVSALYNLFDDQMNIIHIIVAGKRQSDRLSYPQRYLYKLF